MEKQYGGQDGRTRQKEVNKGSKSFSLGVLNIDGECFHMCALG